MLSKEHFQYLSEKYAEFASWAVWADEGEKPKSNIGEMSIFDLSKNPNLLSVLKPDVIMVGLNFSRSVTKIPFLNFHDSRPQGQDYKIRYAFRDTPFYGAYMTDIIKNFEEKVSGNVKTFLKVNKDFELQNIDLFRQKIADLECANPFIIAFENLTYDLLKKHFENTYRIQKVMHYSQQISNEKYKEYVWQTLNLKNKAL